MKKSILFLLLIATVSCSDDFLKEEEKNQATNRLMNLNLLDFDSTGMVEGNVSLTQAETNLQIFEAQIALAVSGGYDGLNVGSLDCYFAVGSTEANFNNNTDGINLPSNFTLQMSERTNLRVFPHNNEKHQLLGIFEKENVNIYGGNLHGDRRSHNNDDVSGHLLNIKSGRQVNVEDVNFFEANGDGVCISSSHHAYEYEPGGSMSVPEFYNTESSQISILNCVFDSNRRNNMSITNGNFITVDNCTFLNAGINMPGISNGRGPSFAIDIEAGRHRETPGDINSALILDEHAHHITIKNCKESGSRIGAFIVAIGDHVEISNNETENLIGLNLGSDVTITGNKIKRNVNASYPTQPPTAINIGSPEITNTVFSNQVSNNIVENYPIGMNFYQKDCLVSGNSILNCGTGMQLRDLEDYIISNNVITNLDTNASGSIRGIIALYYGGVGLSNYLKNVAINNNQININDTRSTSYPIRLAQVNQRPGEENFTVSIEGNYIKSVAPVSLGNVQGVRFESNIFETGFNIGTSSDIVIKGNILNQFNNSNVIYLSGSNNVLIEGNAVRIMSTSGDNNKCINAPNNNSITVNNNSLVDSKDLATLWLSGTVNSVITNNVGHIGSLSDSPHFIYGMNASSSGNTYTNNVANLAPTVRDWYY